MSSAEARQTLTRVLYAALSAWLMRPYSNDDFSTASYYNTQSCSY